MYRNIMMGTILAALLGCNRTNSVAVRLPNNALGSVVHCQHKADCYQQASQVCGGPYTILQADDKPASDFTTSAGITEYVIQCGELQETHASQ